jgi:hypothetical protein
MNRDHQDGNLGEQSHDLPRYIQPIKIRHLEIQQNHVGRILLHTLQRFFSGASLVANLPSALLFEKSSKIVPNCRVVVYHQDPNQAAVPPDPKIQNTDPRST